MARRGNAVAGTGGGRLGSNKETEKLAKEARRQGWTVEVTGGNHIKWTNPEGEVASISGLTPVSVAFSKLKSQLRRKGLHI